MPPVENAAEPTEPRSSEGADEPQPQPDKSAAELIAGDLAKTDPQLFKSSAEKPEPAEPEPSPEREPEPEPTPSPSEPEPEPTPEPGEEPQKPKTAKRVADLLDKLKAQTAETEKYKAMFEPLRQQALSAVGAPQIPPRPPERTPDHWSQRFNALKQQGLADNDPQVIEAVNNWTKYNREVEREQDRLQQYQERAIVQSQTAILNGAFDINARMRFLKPDPASRYGVSVDWDSEMGRTMRALSQRDATPIVNESLVLLYARAAEAALLRQQLGLEHQEADTAKRKLAEGLARGTISSGTRRAPPSPKSRDKALDDLERAAVASGGKRRFRDALGAAAISVDLAGR